MTNPEVPEPETEVKKEVEQDLNEDDQKIKDEVEELVERILGPDAGLTTLALEMLRKMLKSSTGSVTTIPKPLKFLRTHYASLKKNFATRAADFAPRMGYADVISLLSMSCAEKDSFDCLTFKLEGDPSDLEQWGHEYIRYLAGEIGDIYEKRKAENAPVVDLLAMVEKIVLVDFRHNSEPHACDLLLEVGQLQDIDKHCTIDNHSRICEYLVGASDYLLPPINREVLKVVYGVYFRLEQFGHAVRTGMMLNDIKLVQACFEKCPDEAMKKQMGFQLARQRVFMEATGDDDLDEIVGNAKCSEFFLYAARDLNLMDPKTPDQIYKTALDQRSAASANLSSHTQNLASTFVNGFANAAFCTDQLMTTEGNEWLHKNKDHGMMSAAASLGLVMLWDVDSGLAKLDKFLYSNEDYIKAGALMAVGILHCGVRNDCQPALALLTDYLENKTRDMRVAAIIGLGLAYAGSKNEDVSELLLPMVADIDTPLDVCVFAALSLGLVYAGTCDENITEIITTSLMERGEKEDQVGDTLMRFLCLGLGLLFLGQQDNVEAALVVIGTLHKKISKYCELTVKTCAYAGTGNVVQVRELMAALVDKIDDEDEAVHQSVAVMGIGLIAMGEELGATMCKRTFEHILQYGEPCQRRAVPLGLALASVSNPQLIVMDTLGKLTHDADLETALSAILALGLVGAGTNNARIANMLRSLAGYYAKEANHLFLVRVAQGLLFMGKGMLTLNPFHSDRRLMSTPAVAGLLVVLHACLDMKGLILGKYHFLLYYLVCAISPRIAVTIDEDLQPVAVSVRVGQAVDTVAVAGRPKTITGFQTHASPVLLACGDRAVLGTDKYTALAPILEDIVILRRNGDAKDDDAFGAVASMTY